MEQQRPEVMGRTPGQHAVLLRKTWKYQRKRAHIPGGYSSRGLLLAREPVFQLGLYHKILEREDQRRYFLCGGQALETGVDAGDKEGVVSGHHGELRVFGQKNPQARLKNEEVQTNNLQLTSHHLRPPKQDKEARTQGPARTQ